MPVHLLCRPLLVTETEEAQQFIAQSGDIENMLRAGHGHVEQAQFILVRHRTAIGAPQAEIVRDLDPLPFEALGAVDGRDHIVGGALRRRALRQGPQIAGAQFIDDLHNRLQILTKCTARKRLCLPVEHCGWFAAPQWSPTPDEPLRVASLFAPCGVRANALKALDEAGIPWTEVFVGGGIGTVGAAVMAGLAVAPLTRRGWPPRAVDVESRFGLPPLAPIEIAAYTRVRDASLKEAIRIFGAALCNANTRF